MRFEDTSNLAIAFKLSSSTNEISAGIGHEANRQQSFTLINNYDEVYLALKFLYRYISNNPFSVFKLDVLDIDIPNCIYYNKFLRIHR
jgi:hypothetical protein